MNPSIPERTPERHWYSSDVGHQPPRDLVLKLPRRIHEARARLGPGATLDAVLADLRQRGLDVTRDGVVRGWDEEC
jgi:hypothetical protein